MQPNCSLATRAHSGLHRWEWFNSKVENICSFTKILCKKKKTTNRCFATSAAISCQLIELLQRTALAWQAAENFNNIWNGAQSMLPLWWGLASLANCSLMLVEPKYSAWRALMFVTLINCAKLVNLGTSIRRILIILRKNMDALLVNNILGIFPNGSRHTQNHTYCHKSLKQFSSWRVFRYADIKSYKRNGLMSLVLGLP